MLTHVGGVATVDSDDDPTSTSEEGSVDSENGDDENVEEADREADISDQDRIRDHVRERVRGGSEKEQENYVLRKIFLEFEVLGSFDGGTWTSRLGIAANGDPCSQPPSRRCFFI
jgi:hypothetical protein